jgi:uncharacterized protein YndB with AHSA1/START domain
MLAMHQTTEMKIQFEITIQASPEKVWNTLASIEGMRQWFSKNLVFDFVEGGEFRMEVKQKDDGEFTFFGEVGKIDPLKELAFTWTEHEKGKDPWPISTLVRFRLEPAGEGTKVSLTHTGFEELDSAIAQSEFEGHIEGWQRSDALSSLKEVVESSIG